MISTGQKTIEPTSIDVIRIPWFFTVLMVDKVRDSIDFFRDDFNDKVFDNKSKEGVTKTKPSVTTVSVKIQSSMGPHQNHAINEAQR